jgi:hypothetical protein
MKMSIRGRVRNGVVVLDQGQNLPEGSEVAVQLIDKKQRAGSRRSSPSKGSRKGLLKHAGKVKNLPADAARNLDHYLYGHPKK